MIIADSAGSPDIGAEKTRKFIQDKNVIAIIGPYQSSVAIPATQVSEMYKTPFIINVGISDIITERGFQYTFRIIPKVGTYADSKVQFRSDLKKSKEMPIKRVALLYENTAFGTGASLAERKSLKNAGFEVISDISYRADNFTTLHDELQRMRENSGRVVIRICETIT